MVAKIVASTCLGLALVAGAAQAGELNTDMKTLVQGYLEEAKKTDPGFNGFSTERGKKLFYSTRTHSVKNEERGCTTCHTQDPTQQGRTHVGKTIEPISPAITTDRFTDPKKVEKWFKRNCKWVLERECTPIEKGDFLYFMMSL